MKSCKKCKEKIPYVTSICEPIESNNCEEENCGSTPISSYDVKYKLNCEETSQLSFLGITKGMSLDTILEIFGNFIRNIEYIQNPTIESNPNIKTYQDIVNFLLFLINENTTKIEDLTCKVNNLQAQINTLNNTINSINKPQIVDSKGLGFTVNSNLKTILTLMYNEL